jgi:putative hydrolase of the HAD superfamily
LTVAAVVFDVGGVLEFGEDTSWLDSWSARLGLPTHELHARIEGGDTDNRITVGEMTEAEFTRAYQDVLRLTEEQTQQFITEMWDWYCGELDEEMVDYVASLRPAYRTAILSNSSDGARREEEARYGFEQLVDEIVYSHEVGLAKPDPRIYDLTCRRLGVQPEQVAFLDDLPENVEAAKECGWHAFLHVDTPTSIAALNALLVS